MTSRQGSDRCVRVVEKMRACEGGRRSGRGVSVRHGAFPPLRRAVAVRLMVAGLDP